MKSLYFFSIVFLFTFSSFAQQVTKQKPPARQGVKAGFGVAVVQTRPQFPGGDDSLLAYLKRNLHYPESSRNKGEEGQVYVGFMVDSTGKIKDTRVLSSISETLDAEALRVVQSMPDWKPGTAGGSAVNVQWILPVDFILPKKN